jgi:ATP-dependent exoDNAse (exonuclease V) beta subunit
VGFTRPEFELYVIGVSAKKKQFPIDLLAQAKCNLGEKGDSARGSKTLHQTSLPLYHPTDKVEFSSFSSLEALNIEERRRGEFIHRILSFIEYLDEDLESRLEELVSQIKNEENIDCPADTIKRELLEFFFKEDVRPYFISKPSRVIRREQEFSDEKGNLLRMDRVIIDEDGVTVMDYKTGGENKAEKQDILQLKNYMRILKDLYPDKRIEGMIAYIDLKEMVRID